MMLQLRRDGWVSLEADYVFNQPLSQMPQVTTTAQRVPLCPGAIELLLNAMTGVAGYVLVGVSGALLERMFCRQHCSVCWLRSTPAQIKSDGYGLLRSCNMA